jgi:hypothetical protein
MSHQLDCVSICNYCKQEAGNHLYNCSLGYIVVEHGERWDTRITSRRRVSSGRVHSRTPGRFPLANIQRDHPSSDSEP